MGGGVSMNDLTREQIAAVHNKINNNEKLNYEDFLILCSSYGEVEFFYKSAKYGILRLNDDYSSGKDKCWDKTKDYYVFYEWNKSETEQKYKTIEEFAAKASIKGQLLKDIWNEIDKINYAS